MRRRARACVLVAAAGVMVACGGDDGAEPSSEPVPDDPDAVVVADDMAFDPDSVRVPAGEPVTIVIDNQDEGVNHNIQVRGAPEPNRTPLRRGVSQQALTVTLEPGEYELVCDIHPNMTGALTAD